MEPFRVRFRWVIPPNGSPIENALVTFEDGRVTDVATSRSAQGTSPNANAALIPGVVNAHTHFEFSDLQHPLTPARPFTEWIRALIQHRQSRTMPIGETIGKGLQESIDTSTTLVGEINTTGDNLPYLKMETRTVVFRELIGLTPDAMAKQLEIAHDHLTTEPRHPHFIPALSPHAPYSVHPDLLRDIVQLSRAASVTVAMHLAETLAERELLQKGTGEFRAMLEEFGLFSAELFGGRSPMDELRELSRADRALVIHGNYLSDDEIDFLTGQTQMSVVYCPRTHAFFGHEQHPWRTLINRGVRVALGTDSRASNPDLNVWDEAKFLHHRDPDVAPEIILQLATINGEAALLGTKEIPANLIGQTLDRLSVVELPEHTGGEPYASILHPKSQCRSVVEFLRSTLENGSQ